MEQFYLYDEQSLFKGVELRSRQYDADMQEIEYEDGTFIRPQDGLYKAKFVGSKWTETITDEELKALSSVEALPSVEDRLAVTENAVADLAAQLLM